MSKNTDIQLQPKVKELIKNSNLPENNQWKNRFEINSETSDRVYIVSQNKKTGEWGCSCPGWRVRRYCKHLRTLQLLPSDANTKQMENKQ